MAEAGDLIGLDVGHKHTGIARASELAGLAEPLMSVDTAELTKALSGLSKDKKIAAVVVGLPRNLQGEDTSQTTWMRGFVDDFKKQVNLVFYWQDEALTSKLAASSKLKAKSQADEHALAAAIVLQDFLDMPPAGRVLA